MACKLPIDCLNDIFEHLRDDKDEDTLRSCLLVNRLWCKVSVPILWTNIQNYKTLITCLPNESKEILYKNGIIISTLTSKPPLFNYVAFIKILNFNMIEVGIYKNNIIPRSTDTNKRIVIIQEIFKMFMNQISLKRLYFDFDYTSYADIPFITYPGAIDCLKNLSILNCESSIESEFFHQLSQICHHIQLLKIDIGSVISNELTKLISVQQNLKYLRILYSRLDNDSFKKIIPSLIKLPNTLITIKLKVNLYYFDKTHAPFILPLSFLAKFTNLQEIVLSALHSFENLQHVTFPQLQILKFHHNCPGFEFLNEFLKNNGKNLKVLQLDKMDFDLLDLDIAKFCPNLKSLYVRFLYNEVEKLKEILISCQQLESIGVWCGDDDNISYLNVCELLNVLAKYSPKKFHELKIHYLDYKLELIPEELESVLISWANRVPQKSLSLIIFVWLLYLPDSIVKKENMEIIEKFKKLGVIKKFETFYFDVCNAEQSFKIFLS